MRQFLLVLMIGGLASGQGLVEYGAAAAGGSAGGVAGKKVSDGISSIFNKVNHTAAAASKAKKNSDEPLMEVGPGTPRAPSVPPPPPLKHAADNQKMARHRARRSGSESTAAFAAPAPPPQMEADELEAVAAGESRKDLLKMGAPAARITMVEDGHMVEIYRYMSGDNDLGAVHLTDGRVSSVQLQ